MREMLREEWIEECRKEEEFLVGLMKKIDKSSYESEQNPIGKYRGFDHRFVFSLKNGLRERGKSTFHGVFFKLEIEKVFVQYPDDEEVEEWNGQIEEEEIEHFSLLPVKELREMTGKSQKLFSDYLMIPKRTIQNWEGNVNECPDYTLMMISEKVSRDFDLR